ncbi:MAG TPA: hypothetical protein VF618_10670 [Thermoanaerobaculia bacterium]
MSQNSGEKARANIGKKRRTKQRVKDRARRVELGLKGPTGDEKPQAETAAPESK